MLKKRHEEGDMFLNSNIMIQMDEKRRMKSHYMKKYNERLKKVQVTQFDPRPAGTRNFMRADISVDEPAHLNPTRRRILNDYVSKRPDHSNESLGNRNIVTEPSASMISNLPGSGSPHKQIPSSYDYEQIGGD